MTDDAFTLMENNIVEITSPALAAYYAADFEQLWQKGHIENTGNVRTVPVTLQYSGNPAPTRVMFSPGYGLDIDAEIAKARRECATPHPHLQPAAQLGHADQRAHQCVA